MFSRNEKLILAALAFCVFVTGAMIPSATNWWILTSDENNTRYAEYYHSKCEAQNPIGLPAEGQSVVSAAPKNHKKLPKEPKAKKEPDDPDYCDLAAQYVAARAAETSSYWAFLTFIATAVGVALLWLTLAATTKTLAQAIRATSAAENTNETTLKTGRDQSRAYINAFEARIYEHAPEAITLYIKNFGQTPARYFSVTNHVRKMQFDGSWFNEIEKDEGESKWTALGPGETTTIAIIPEIGNLTHLSTGATCIKGRIDYCTVYDEECFTEFAYALPHVFGFEFEDKGNDTASEGGRTMYARMIRPGTKRPLRAYANTDCYERDKP